MSELTITDSDIVDVVIDCRSEVGETIGLIDAAIHIFRLISRRDLSSLHVREALYDLADDSSVQFVLEKGKIEIGKH